MCPRTKRHTNHYEKRKLGGKPAEHEGETRQLPASDKRPRPAWRQGRDKAQRQASSQPAARQQQVAKADPAARARQGMQQASHPKQHSGKANRAPS